MDTLTDGAARGAPNRMTRSLNRLNEWPGALQSAFRNIVLRRTVPFVGTARLSFAEVTPHRVQVQILNRPSVRNHIGSVHAAAMVLLAETATGMVVGMNVRDDCVPLLKSTSATFVRRARGSLIAVATLDLAQRSMLWSHGRGQVDVSVEVTDENGDVPLECQFVWAWRPSIRTNGERAAATAKTGD